MIFKTRLIAHCRQPGGGGAPRSGSPRCAAIVILLSIIAAASPALAQNWPQFRGPEARGVALEGNLPQHWSATENIAWRREMTGRGWSSPIVWGNRVIVTTVVSTGDVEAADKGLYRGGNRLEPSNDVHHWKVQCLDLATGQPLWDRQVHEAVPTTGRHLKNSYASETPVTDGRRIYAYFGNVGVFCLDLNGQLLWEKRLEPQPTRFEWGTAASPVLHDGRLYVVNDNDAQSYLLALDAASGEELFRVQRDEGSNWSTPYIWKHELRTELVTLGTDAVRSYDLEGNLLWELRGMSSITIATPYEAGGLLYISSGYVLDELRPIYAIRPGAVGDISLTEGQTVNDSIAWSRPDAAPYNPTTLVYEDLLYVLDDRGFLACYEAATGEVVYERQRLPGGRAFTASPWACDGLIYCLNEDGLTYVVRAGRQFELLHTNALEDDEMSLATPALVGDRLLIRTDRWLYCIRKR